MDKKALVVIDIQNDITKHYRDIIDNINSAIDWSVSLGMTVIYIKHNNLSPGTRTFKPDTKGVELVPELKVVSDNIFVKTKANALISRDFSEYIRENGINEFFITGADATACVKSTCFNMTKAGYTVHVISDCVTSYDLKKMPEMLAYYANKGCEVKTLAEYLGVDRDLTYYAIHRKYITLRDEPELKDAAAAWFHSKWGIPEQAYLDCMTAYLNRETEYGWYLCLDGHRISGGMGVIENDFHDRKDLMPNVCAVYTEEAYRGQGIAGRLLNMVVEDMRSKGISPLYLVTDHTGFYERYGWAFLCMVQGDGEPEMTRMYVHR